MDSDVIVIGAGVAGLSAAGALARQGWNVRILEARDRVGGRIFSTRPPGWPGAVELGAEFIHGSNPATAKILKRAGARKRRIACNVWWRDEKTGELALLPDYWERIGTVVDRISKRDAGRTFQQFLRQHREISLFDRALAGHYVGGFEAAPTARISAKALRADRAGTDAEDNKIVGRYDSLVRELVRELPRERVGLQLNSVVQAIRWEKGQVMVRTAGSEGIRPTFCSASAVVITLPLGVLKAGDVEFYPALREKRRLIAKLGWGHVVRITLRFRRGFWKASLMPGVLGARNGRNFGFVNAPPQTLPVWWALTPPAPILTGWAGGDASKGLRHQSPAKVLKEAMNSLAGILGTTSRELRRWIVDWRCHQWSDDPFTLGAYSFPVAKLEDGAIKLAQPVASTIFFAGEATAVDYGTVHGAIESGMRVAGEVGAALEARSRRRENK